MGNARNIAPGPRGHVLLGSLWQVRTDRLGFVTALTRQYGPIVRFRMVHQVLHLVSQPDAIRHALQDNADNYVKGVGLAQAKLWLGEGLVTSEGETWARQRKLIQPSFHRQRLEGFAPVVTQATAAMLARWRSSAAAGSPVNVATEMMRLTLTVIARIMFSADLSESNDVGAAFSAALRDAMDRMVAVVALPDWLPFPGKRRFRSAVRVLDGIVTRIIREHRQAQTSDRDLLATLIDARDSSVAGFEDGELRDQVMTILLAGHETTASSIAWTLYLLDRNPEALAGVVAEVERVVGDGVPTHDVLARLQWTRMVYEEALRLYPPVWLIPRRSVAADQLAGYDVPARSDVLVSPWVLHRNPEYWDEPEAFRPERFTPERVARRPRYAYLPFGAGPRVCVGSALATMEALLIITMVVQHYRMRLVPDHPVVADPLLTLRFRHGLPMTAELRRARGVAA